MPNTSPLLNTHTARLQCDHCGYSHEGVSQNSLADAYTHARLLLENCKHRRESMERQIAQSVRNARRTNPWNI